RQRARHVVVGVQAAEEEGAAVEVDDEAVVFRGVWGVDAHGHVTGGRPGGEVLHRVQRQPLLGRRDLCLLGGAHRGGVEGTGRRGGQARQDLGGLGGQRQVSRHGLG